MSDIEFIKEFANISIKQSCKNVKVDKYNMYHGKVSDDKVKLVADNLIDEVENLIKEYKNGSNI